MRTLKWVLAGLLVGIVAVSFRDMQRGEWLRPARSPVLEPGGEEPVLGYDGMDQETLLDWLGAAQLDESSIERIIRYEEANLGREPVLEALEELLG